MGEGVTILKAVKGSVRKLLIWNGHASKQLLRLWKRAKPLSEGRKSDPGPYV